MVLLRAVNSIVERLLALVPKALRVELANDPQHSITSWFGPIELAALQGGTHTSDDCSCDGYYLDNDGLLRTPAICFRADVDQSRVKFTLLHELGHHLLRSIAPDLLDLIDQAAGADGDPGAVEERACHAFAAALLVPDETLEEVLAGQPPRPEHVVQLHESCKASWEAIAVKVAGRIQGAGAVVLLREPGTVSFAAPSPGMPGRWPRSSPVDPNGPLARALQTGKTARHDTYRWHLYGSRTLWSDTLPVHPSLAIGVLTEAPSDGGLNVLPDSAADPVSDPDPCPRCHDGYLTVDWCERCKGRRCPDCHACACTQTGAAERACLHCHLVKRNSMFPDDSEICFDCE